MRKVQTKKLWKSQKEKEVAGEEESKIKRMNEKRKEVKK